MPTTWFITGSSSGFGRLLTERLLDRGDRVAATARRPEALDDLRAEHGNRLWVARLDVTDAGQAHRVVDDAFAALGVRRADQASDRYQLARLDRCHPRRAAAPARAGARAHPADLDGRRPGHVPQLRLLPRVQVGD